MSTTGSDPLIELETRMAFLERLVDQLNDVILQQQGQIDGFVSELKRVRETMDSPQDSIPEAQKPPHY